MFNYCDRWTKWKSYFFIDIHLLESIFDKNTHTIAYRHIHYTPHWPSLIYLIWIIWQLISLCYNFTSPAFLVLLFAPLRYFSFFPFKIFIISYKVFHFIVVDYYNIFTVTLFLQFGEIWILFSIFLSIPLFAKLFLRCYETSRSSHSQNQFRISYFY